MSVSHALSRRSLIAVAAVSAVAGLTPESGKTRQATPPPAVQPSKAEIDQFVALSRTLCGGGRFDPDAAAQLLTWLNADPGLRQGLARLLDDPEAASISEATPSAPALSPQTEAAEAILTFWYVGYFDGKPIADRWQAYDQLIAWQAMYTLPFAECKEWGAWSQPPNTEPTVLGL